MRLGIRKWGAGLLGAAAALFASTAAHAGTPYEIDWNHYELVFPDESVSCEAADLQSHDGDPFYSVDGVPLPTHQVTAVQPGLGGASWIGAKAGFDSVLLQPGSNVFTFNISIENGDNSCVFAHEVSHLVSAPLSLNKPLFDVMRIRTAYQGATTLPLTLQEINPALAQALENLRAAIDAARKDLVANAPKIADLAAKEAALQQLDADLTSLAASPFDAITEAELDAILAKYSNLVDAATKTALDEVITDYKKAIADLQNELQTIITDFNAQADAAADLATQAARNAGWNPDDPTNYTVGGATYPSVDVPDFGDVDAFSPANDPYDAYANKVLAQLGGDVSGTAVVGRADFILNVRAWRQTEKALSAALANRAGVSKAEYTAFINGQNKVAAFVKQFMDASDWFTDTPVPADTRSFVDGVLHQAFGDLADQMKYALNLWGGPLSGEENELCQTISALGGAISAITDGVQQYQTIMLDLTTGAARIAVGFVPVAGQALDLCEAITGKSWCLPSGADLSDEQRLFQAMAVAAGPAIEFWRGAKLAATTASAVKVAEDAAESESAIVRIGEQLGGCTPAFAPLIATALPANVPCPVGWTLGRTWYSGLRGSAKALSNDFEVQVGYYLQKNGRQFLGIGDDGVRSVLGIPKTAPTGSKIALAPDFLTITPGNGLALTEVKAAGNAADVNHAIDQMTNAMTKMDELGYVGKLEKLELAIPAGAGLDDQRYIIVSGYIVDTVTNARKTIKVGATTLPIAVIQF